MGASVLSLIFTTFFPDTSLKYSSFSFFFALPFIFPFLILIFTSYDDDDNDGPFPVMTVDHQMVLRYDMI